MGRIPGRSWLRLVHVAAGKRPLRLSSMKPGNPAKSIGPWSDVQVAWQSSTFFQKAVYPAQVLRIPALPRCTHSQKPRGIPPNNKKNKAPGRMLSAGDLDISLRLCVFGFVEILYLHFLFWLPSRFLVSGLYCCSLLGCPEFFWAWLLSYALALSEGALGVRTW